MRIVQYRQQALQQSLQVAAGVADAEQKQCPSYSPPCELTTYDSFSGRGNSQLAAADEQANLPQLVSPCYKLLPIM